MSNVTKKFLESMQYETDPPADEAVRAIMAGGEGEKIRINELFDKLITTRDPLPAGLPPAAEKFFEESVQLPDWADPALIKRGEELFGTYGPPIVLMLFCRALPFGYAAPRAAEVMVTTGRLVEHQRGKNRLDALNRRILETAQFILNVMARGGLGPDGSGIRTTQKVRLIHASIRYYIKQKGDWDTEEYGEPVNQLLLAATSLCFSIVSIDGLAKVGIKLDEDEQRAYLHCWNVVGHVLGIRDELVAHEPAEARELFDRIFAIQRGASPAGRELTSSLVDYMNSKFPFDFMNTIPPFFINKLCGHDVAELLGVKYPDDWALKLVLAAMRAIDPVIDTLDQNSAFFRNLTNFISFRLLQGLIHYYNEEKEIEFDIPPSLRKDWNLA